MLYCLLKELCNHNLQDQKDKCVYNNKSWKKKHCNSSIVRLKYLTKKSH